MPEMTPGQRRTVKDDLLGSMFSGPPPEAAEVRPWVERDVNRRGYTLEESGLGPWSRQLELELGALSGGMRRSAGLSGLGGGGLDLAMLAVSGIMSLRGRGVGPASWLLWLDQSFTSSLSDMLARGVLDGLPLASLLDRSEGMLLASDPGWAASAEWDRSYSSYQSRDSETWPLRSGTGSFGQVCFSVSADLVMTWAGLSREHKGRYATHEILGALPRLEFLAPEITATSFSVRLDAGLGASPASSMETLAGLCRAGRVERLVMGGRNLGPHVLESARESWRHTAQGGAPLVIEAELTLKEYA